MKIPCRRRIFYRSTSIPFSLPSHTFRRLRPVLHHVIPRLPWPRCRSLVPVPQCHNTGKLILRSDLLNQLIISKACVGDPQRAHTKLRRPQKHIFHGCLFLAEGAKSAARRMSLIFSSSSGMSLYFRILLRSVIAFINAPPRSRMSQTAPANSDFFYCRTQSLFSSRVFPPKTRTIDATFLIFVIFCYILCVFVHITKVTFHFSS